MKNRKSQDASTGVAQNQGFLLIDKPAGMTSHDVVDQVRRITDEQRVGHAGTLDPFATGLLIVGVGRAATREMKKLVGLDKEYEAVFVLGASSTTDDVEGEKREAPLVRNVTTDDFIPFIGQIEQIPPTYSAIKVRGKKMYEAAREGRPIEGKARNVTVYSFELQKHPQPLLEKTGDRIAVTIQCSSGTYIRALARDLGTSLGGGGYVEELRRTKIGPFSIDQATALERVVMRSLIPIDDFLDHLSHPDDPKPVSF